MEKLENKLSELLEIKYNEEDFSDCYTVEINIGNRNKIEIFVDSDSGMTIGKCTKISRYLEKYLDEEVFPDIVYTLEVSSPGIERPLIKRQYQKNIGRHIELLLTDDNKIDGILEVVNENDIVILVKNKKEFDQKNINFEDIQKGKIIIKFNKKQK
ncbi:MAG: hypothetical protein R2771_12740 [Saprospiraceae bacterium]